MSTLGKSPKLRQRQQPAAGPSNLEYERVHEDEHHTDVYQNPVSPSFTELIALGL